MNLLLDLRSWFARKINREQSGQGSIEYVLLILGCVLFLIAAAILLNGMLSSAVSSITSWANAVGAP